MPEAPTKEGQNAIIKNLSQISMTVLGLAIAGLFAWGQGLSRDINDNKVIIQALQDKIEGLNKKIDNQMLNVYKDIHDNEGDISDLNQKVESMHDDSRIRITHLEDWQLFHNK